LSVGGKEFGLEVNADRMKYVVMYRDQNAGQSHTIQCVPGGKDLTSGECSLGQTIPI